MFALVRGVLQVLPNQMDLDGNKYTDLWKASSTDLESLGIVKLPEQPSYDGRTHKVVPNAGTKDWDVVALTSSEKDEIVADEYNRFYLRTKGTYNHYVKLYQSLEDEQRKLQIEKHILNLAQHCLDLQDRKIATKDLTDYPDPQLEFFGNPLV